MIIAPCKDCVGRELGCHSKCERYASYRAAKDEEGNKRRKIREREAEHCDYRRKAIAAVRKRNLRGGEV